MTQHLVAEGSFQHNIWYRARFNRQTALWCWTRNVELRPLFRTPVTIRRPVGVRRSANDRAILALVRWCQDVSDTNDPRIVPEHLIAQFGLSV